MTKNSHDEVLHRAWSKNGRLRQNLLAIAMRWRGALSRQDQEEHQDSGGHMTRLPLGKVHRRTSKNFCAFLEVQFRLVLLCFVGRRTSETSIFGSGSHPVRLGIFDVKRWELSGSAPQSKLWYSKVSL